MDIVFQFIGGPLDGKTVTGQAGQQDEADRYFVLTHHGKIGQRFRVASRLAIETLAQEELKHERPHHFQQHTYRVADRRESEGQVVVRVEYVEQQGRKASERIIRRHLEPSRRAASHDQIIAAVLQRAAQTMRDAYSHCWPAPSAPDPGTSATVRLHLAAALLGRDFAVFVDVPHPAGACEPVELVAIAPSQDWFIAAHCAPFVEAAAREAASRATRQLATFWLHPQLAIPPCQDHVRRIARHCHRGYGLLAGQHCAAQPMAKEDLQRLVRAGCGSATAADSLAQQLSDADARWHAPISIRQFEGHGCYYLTAVHFQINHPADDESDDDEPKAGGA